ncbi:MAG: ABC transporter permease [Dysgonamonadaceae bacterium]|nr:ABC transporter permease [Dysgonamonadaceae bacterium]
MNNINLIIGREYSTRVRKKSFILMTLLTPFLMVGLVFVPLWLSSIKDGNIRNIAVIDQTGVYAPLFESTDLYKFQTKEQMPLLGGDIFAILEISGDLSENPQAVSLTSERQAPQDLQSIIRRTLNEKVTQQRLDALADSKDVSTEAITQVRSILDSGSNISLRTLRQDGEGNVQESSTVLAAVIGMVFTILIYMFLLMYGAMVMQAVLEEKKSRIVEVMVSSVKPVKLLIGKIIGIGLVGITQLLLWGILVSVLFGVLSLFISMPAQPEIPMASPVEIGGFDIEGIMASVMNFNWLEIIVYFILFFIGGYILYASIFAMFASAVDSDEDTQQFMMPVMIIIMFALYAGIYSVSNPDGPLAFWASLIPFTSPIVMMVRIPFGIPLWEKLLSLVLLYGTFLLISVVAAKIYRVGILMYGKKPTLKEMVKWLRYK